MKKFVLVLLFVFSVGFANQGFAANTGTVSVPTDSVVNTKTSFFLGLP
ncbi:MAG: hypothetical protein M0D57_11365 [Sphingobacteriales bacterium JAD_PAG50586_3]|nr:MAG: hypothetical protein M0D57_11365 [Sphingobacteriales bacterium JAD_PAG50586_3]